MFVWKLNIFGFNHIFKSVHKKINLYMRLVYKVSNGYGFEHFATVIKSGFLSSRLI